MSILKQSLEYLRSILWHIEELTVECASFTAATKMAEVERDTLASRIRELDMLQRQEAES